MGAASARTVRVARRARPPAEAVLLAARVASPAWRRGGRGRFRRRRLGSLPEHLHGVRDEAATRELIILENRKYSRRQLIWFRKEPNLRWIHASGERADTQEEVARLL